MGNPERGEVRVTVAGVDYLLRYTTNAICTLEERTEERAVPLLKRFAAMDTGMADLRVIVWAGLLDHQPATTLAAAGDLVDQARQDGVSLVEPVMEAFGLALAEMTGGNPPRPATSRSTKKTRTTAGRRSSPPRSRPASTPTGSGA